MTGKSHRPSGDVDTGTEVCGVTVLCAVANEETRELDEAYGLYSMNSW